MIGLFGQHSRAGGVVNGRLTGCPASPNCVSSVSPQTDKTHYVKPLNFADPTNEAWSRLVEIVKTWPRAHIVEQSGSYLHAEFRTRLLRFVDDVEFLLDPGQGVIHVRSLSRLGRSDFGVNRRRIEAIRRQFERTN